MIANGLVRGALPALGQPKTPATIPHCHRRGKEFRHRFMLGASRRTLAPSGCCESGCRGCAYTSRNLADQGWGVLDCCGRNTLANPSTWN
jgi:hypothetical protein